MRPRLSFKQTVLRQPSLWRLSLKFRESEAPGHSRALLKLVALVLGGLVLIHGAPVEATSKPTSSELQDQGPSSVAENPKPRRRSALLASRVTNDDAGEPRLFVEAKAREIRVGLEKGIVQLILVDSAGRESILPVSRGLEDGVLLSQWDEDDALLIESELQERNGAYYRLPATRQELLAELGLPKSAVLSNLEVMELVAVQIERQLSTTAATSNFLLEQMELSRQREAVADGFEAENSADFDFDELERDLGNMSFVASNVAEVDSREAQQPQAQKSQSSKLGLANSSLIREVMVDVLKVPQLKVSLDHVVTQESLSLGLRTSSILSGFAFNTFENKNRPWISSPLRKLTSPAVVEADRDSISTSF